jgi:aryl-alcohol dehydrogenase-like predicted oxidoreductase
VEETAATLATLVERGRIHYFGVSSFRAWRVARLVETCRAMGVPQPIVCQPPYSAMTRTIEAELLPCCAHYGLAAVVYSPLARGVLSGKYLPDAPLPEGTRAARADRRLMQTEFRRESLQLAQRMTEQARHRGLTTAQLALAWVWNNRLVHGLVAGPRTLEQWRQYLDALDVPFTADDEAFVSGLVPAGHASTYGYTDPIYPVTGRAPRTTP